MRSRNSTSRTRGPKRVLVSPYTLRILSRRVNNISSMIETKSGVWASASNQGMPHNNIYIVTAPGNGLAGERLNMLQTNRGTNDGMGSGSVSNRIGDKITVKGVMIKAMIENQLSRSKVHYRMMVVKCAKGDVPTRTTLYQNNSSNKMIDQVNTERYTVIAQKKFNITAANPHASIANVTDGIPEDVDVAGLANSGQATKLINMWIPGRKFGRNGNVTYQGAPGESNVGSVEVKFFDYYIIFLCYDWYGTPQDIVNVGRINSLYTKLYFKDA